MNLKMYNFPVCFTIKQKIDFLQRVILIHSYLYYVIDFPVWDDRKYDIVSKQLKEEQSRKKTKWIQDRTQYGYVFYDYDGNTGFDLYDRLTKHDKEKIKLLALQCLKEVGLNESSYGL